MKKIILFGLVTISYTAYSQLSAISSFNPSNTSGLCGVAYFVAGSNNVWVYGCSDAEIQRYTDSGVYVSSIPVAGEPANDVDLFISIVPMNVGGNILPAGTMIMINGETDEAEVYAIDSSGTVTDTLQTAFGVSHVVGGAYHHLRNSYFLVQDNVPGTAAENMVAEIDAVTGDTIQTFQTTADFNISYGDIDVNYTTGNLYLVSSVESSIAEYTPTGSFVGELQLPSGVSDLSGIAVDCISSMAWVCTTNGMVYQLGIFPCLTPGIEESVSNISASVYPNPFQGSTQCHLQLKRNADVCIALYDITGREAGLVYDGSLPAGRSSFHVEVPASGIYILKAMSEDASAQLRLVHVDCQ